MKIPVDIWEQMNAMGYEPKTRWERFSTWYAEVFLARAYSAKALRIQAALFLAWIAVMVVSHRLGWD